MRTIELLSPAKNAETGKCAILAGADAVYIGAPAFGARAAATNSIEDIADLVAFAHRYEAKVYVTLNTILFDTELEEAQKMVWQLYSIGVDALIVQDMAYLMMHLPPIALHASTQCDIRTVEKARFLSKAGFSQLVLPREFSPEEIKDIHDAVDIPLEVFVHGALCVSYSGDCHAGFVATGRSANRGACPQMCRLPYDLVDSSGNKLGERKHYLSLRDLNRLDDLGELIAAGASSFKIEGRLKDSRYVTNVTAAYSAELDRIIAQSDGNLCRSSIGKTTLKFKPDVNRTFNRGYTNLISYADMASLDSPKWIGIPVAKTNRAYDPRKKYFTVAGSPELANGDGLGYFDQNNDFVGFRLNKVEGNKLYPAQELLNLKSGSTLYRNSDKQFFDILDSSPCKRFIEIDIAIFAVDNDNVAIEISRDGKDKVTTIFNAPNDKAKTPQNEQRKRILAKLGDTIYTLRNLDDRLGDRFISASILTAARRNAIETFDIQRQATYRYDRRKTTVLKPGDLEGKELDFHDNIANRLSQQFYSDLGAKIKRKALEAQPALPNGEIRVMTTKYCIRRQLGACLKGRNAHALPSPIFLSNESGKYRLDFDCKRCGMNIIKLPKQ